MTDYKLTDSETLHNLNSQIQQAERDGILIPCVHRAILQGSLDLINRLQAENEKLQVELDLAKAFQKEKESEFSLLKYKYNKILSQLDSYQDIVKLATIKEYREKAAIKLAENARSDYWHWIDDTLYEVEKEMVGE